MNMHHRPDVSRVAETVAPVPAALRAATVIWKPDGRATRTQAASLPAVKAMLRGAAGRCPACGTGALFSGWLRITPVCRVCDAQLGTIRADDAPPYFTILIVAHLVVGLLVLLERTLAPSVATEMMIFLPGTLLLTLALMRPVKGATVGLMLKLGLMASPGSPDGMDDGSGNG